MKIDVRSKEAVYITINGVTYYIDDSTNEQIVEVYKGNVELLQWAGVPEDGSLTAVGEVVGMKKIVSKDRVGSFGSYEEEGDFKDQEEILNAIKRREDNRYFDKYGNEYSIEEIAKTSTYTEDGEVQSTTKNNSL